MKPPSLIFVITSCLCVFSTLGLFGENPEIDLRNYTVSYVPDLDAYFYVDDIPDGIKWHLRQGIYWESGIGNLIKYYVKKGSVAVDVGAHIGIHTITMSRKVGPLGQVIAFEPQKKIHAEHLANLSLNHCNNVTTLRKALGENFRTIQMTASDPTNEGGTPIGLGGDFAEMITLDSLNLQNVSLIKIDVESYEFFVFQGARDTILRNKPVIIFEIMGGYDYNNCSQEIKEQFEKTIELVTSYGYSVTLIFGNDYIALPKSECEKKSMQHPFNRIAHEPLNN
ncbi:MAG: FkbM family methyltransferase [Chlamydiales bacterium]|nr:FkbM family methyltransferase [Chlamydiales bacterium]